MPTPSPGESKEDFVSRCISDVVEEGTEQEQAIAICHSMYEEKEVGSEMSEATEKCYDEVMVVEKMPSTWATSFAEYDAEEAAEEAVEEIQGLTKLFNVMIENVMFDYSVEDRVTAIQVLTDEYKARITELMKTGGIKTFDDSDWDSDATSWKTAEAYCKDCLFDFNAPGAEKTKELGLLPYRKNGAAPNKSALQDIATSLKAVKRPKGVSQDVFDVKKQQAANKMLGWWAGAFDERAPESIYEVAGKSRPVEEVIETESVPDSGLGQLKGWIEEIKSFFIGAKSLDVYQSGFKLTKGPDGKSWILLWSTNAFIDREKEIFTTKSIDDFIQRHTDDDVKGEVWFCHLPGSKFANLKMQARVGRFLLEAAPFDDTEMGQAFEKFFQENPDGHPVLAPNGWGQSHGYKFLRKDRVDGVYTAFEKYESTILPWDIAANQHNPRPMFTTEGNLMNEKQRAAFTGVFGADLVDQMVAQGETKTAELEATGVAYKAVDEVVEEKATEEATEEVVVEEEKEVEVEVEEEVVAETTETETEEKETEVVEPVSREEITQGLKVLAEEMAKQFSAMVDEKITAAVDELIEVVVPLARQVKAMSEADETKIAKSVSETPTSSLAAMVLSSIIGSKETHVDGRTTLAKDGPEEGTKEANGPKVAGVSLNLW